MTELEREQFLTSSVVGGKNIPLSPNSANSTARAQVENQPSQERKSTDKKAVVSKPNPLFTPSTRPQHKRPVVAQEKPTSVQELKKKGEEIPDFGDGLSAPPRITMIDEDREKVYLEKEDNSSLTWKIIKGTVQSYRKRKK